MFPAVDAQQQADIEAMKDLVLTEVNVKELKIADASAHVLVKRVKPNFRELGKRYGKLMKALAAVLTDLPQEQIAALEQAGSLHLEVEGQPVDVQASDVEIISEDMPGWLVANEGRVTVALDITVTDALKREGTARELVKRIQNLRKASGLEITDRIRVTLQSQPESDAAVEQFRDYIAQQVLASELVTTAAEAPAGAETFEMDGYTLWAQIAK
jgi:isoleucyl-tRNA synthetase